MARRPASTAGSARPMTSNGPRPTTSAGQSAFFDHREPRYTYGHDYPFEEEEEDTDDDDVFAFLPPSTADQRPQDHDYQQILLPSPPPPPPQISFPSPTFNPYARYPADSTVGPSSQYFLPPPQSPPSTATDSNTHNNTQDDHFRLRRLNTATTASHPPATVESRQVHVSLPGGRISEKDSEAGVRRRPHQKRPDSSIADSLSVTPSMVDDDETEGSIKCVFLFVFLFHIGSVAGSLCPIAIFTLLIFYKIYSRQALYV